jgi:hypothetical protein
VSEGASSVEVPFLRCSLGHETLVRWFALHAHALLYAGQSGTVPSRSPLPLPAHSLLYTEPQSTLPPGPYHPVFQHIAHSKTSCIVIAIASSIACIVFLFEQRLFFLSLVWSAMRIYTRVCTAPGVEDLIGHGFLDLGALIVIVVAF